MNTIRQKLHLILAKCGLIVRLCGQGRSEDAFAGVGDFTGAITELLKDVTAAGDNGLTALFGCEGFLKPLQTIMLSMAGMDTAALKTAMRDGMIPLLERAYETVNEGLASQDSDRDMEEGLSSSAMDILRGFEAVAKAADRSKPEAQELWSADDARSWADSIDYDGKPRAICLFGNADGNCAKALQDRLSRGSILLIFEPEHTNIIDFREELQAKIDYYMQESLLIVQHPLYKEIFMHEYATFIKAINENRTRVMVNRNTLARFREDAPRNVIRNLPMMEHANLVGELGRILPVDVPVIIVSAGPSLDKNIEELRRAKGHSLIFAVDTAMKYLLARDIVPDLGITVEPIKPMVNYEDPRCFLVPHIFDNESNPEIVGRHTARKFIYNCRDYVKRLLEALGKEVPADSPSGGSVATAAFAICYRLQMRRIILVGQDLAYSGEATHAGGVESKGINNDIGYEMIDAIDGGKVRSRTDWLAYLKWFENAIALMKDSGYDMEVIDATEGGALIHGSRVMTLTQAIDEYCVLEYDFAKELERLPYLLNSREWERFGELVAKSAAQLDDVEQTSVDAVKLCAEALGGEKTAETASLSCAKEAGEKEKTADIGAVLQQLRRSREFCEQALLYPLINNYAVTGIAQEVSRLRLEEAGTASELGQQKLAFEAIAEACGYFRKVMGEGWKS